MVTMHTRKPTTPDGSQAQDYLWFWVPAASLGLGLE